MTHYPGSKAGSLVSWVVPQYSDTQIAAAHQLQCYSRFGTVTTAALHTYSCRQLSINSHSHTHTPGEEYGEVMCADCKRFSGFPAGREGKSQTVAMC